MHDTAKYLIHADITADGVIERSDVVGAIFGQTEGLLGDELDLRDLQDSSKVGRIDVDVDSQNGQSYGRITIATSLDQIETAILGAALETIDRVGPCRSTIEIRRIEDVRAAKRREVVERAKALLGEAFDGSMQSSRELVAEVREAVRIEDITEYEGLPAGPRVADGDAIIVVEGRADVATLLRYGVKNAIGVEGTNVPDAVAELTRDRTVTAFLDGDRGGELILRELAQVGEIDYVAFAPEGRSVEDLKRHEAMAALREKVPYDRVSGAEDIREAAVGPTGVSEITATDAPEVERETATRGDGRDTPEIEPTGGDDTPEKSGTLAASDPDEGSDEPGASDAADRSEDSGAGDAAEEAPPETLRGHVGQVIDGETGRARLLDADFGTLAEGDAEEAFDLLASTDPVPTALVVDGEVSQRVLDVAAQRGLDQIVAASEGEFVKQPTSVRIRTAEELRPSTET